MDEIGKILKRKIVLKTKRHTHTCRSPLWNLKHLISPLNSILKYIQPYDSPQAWQF